jgi:acyl homoserine lactone synthase
MNIQIGRVSDGSFPASDIQAMHELRFAVFRERLKWDVRCEERSEIDHFDALDPTYMLVKDDAGCVCACWRLLPTSGPTMLQDIFPQLLGGEACPRDPQVWELSRFAMGRHEAAANRFCDTAILMMEVLMEFALARGITCFVTVTTVAIERLLKGAGVPMRRYGVPVQVGVERTLALSIPVSPRTLELLRARRSAALAMARLAA